LSSIFILPLDAVGGPEGARPDFHFRSGDVRGAATGQLGNGKKLTAKSRIRKGSQGAAAAAFMRTSIWRRIGLRYPQRD
jgi:hypothetical protein